MAGVASRRLADSPGWRMDVCKFEAWAPGADDPPFDLLVSAQAWHWFEPDARFLRAYELLRPGGWLALWWNRPAVADTPARRAIGAAYERHAPEIVHRGVAGHGRPAFEPTPARAAFGPPLERAYPWTCRYGAAEWTELMRTSSDHRMLPEERRETLLAAVRAAIEEQGGVYEHQYECVLWAAERR